MTATVLAVAVALLAGSGETARAAVAPGGCKARPAVEARPLTAAAADRMRLSPGTTRGARADEFLLRDGRVLVQAESAAEGALYTADSFKLRRAQLDEDLRLRRVGAGEEFHLLRGMIDDGDGFVRKVSSLLVDLRRRLASEGLDAGEHPSPTAAADALAQLAARWRQARCRPDPQLFRELTAGAGELVLRRAGPGARWSVRLVDGMAAPVVELVGPGERRVLPWLWVDELLSSGEGALLSSVVEAALTQPSPAPAPAPAPVPARREPAATDKPATAPSAVPAVDGGAAPRDPENEIAPSL